MLLGFYLFCFDPADMNHIGPDEISSDILDFKYSTVTNQNLSFLWM